MVPLPPLNLNTHQDAKSGADGGTLNMAGSSWGMGSGDWVVNVPTSSGPGLSLMGGASSGIGTKTILAIGAGLALLLLLRKRGK